MRASSFFITQSNANNMKKLSEWWVYLAGVIAVIGVIIHIAAIFGGPSWYAYFGAPPQIVQSAREGTWLAPVSTMMITALMAICAAFAFSALGLIRRLPLLRTGLAGMAAICLLRSMILWPLMINHPELRNTFEIVAAIVWGLAGVGFVFGFRLVHAHR
ncbi:hypothetical protein GCM10011282_23900 [Undibacterium macrobrachii]|uniref:DUF1761 domain-containing protein n=2 Tax=Undibacterium macrobrachii TaxID=1119058 RepID=A0ABQ2XHQ9_9BURK|nr:hypothetical protein GCM10011282_23900 [Undibacterium macrobrachii]